MCRLPLDDVLAIAPLTRFMFGRPGDAELATETIQRFLLGYLARGSSEDVAQETFLRAYRKIDRYDCNRPFLPLVRTAPKSSTPWPSRDALSFF